MGHLHMKRQGVKSTSEKSTDTDLCDNSKNNLVFCVTVEPRVNKEGKI